MDDNTFWFLAAVLALFLVAFLVMSIVASKDRRKELEKRRSALDSYALLHYTGASSYPRSRSTGPGMDHDYLPTATLAAVALASCCDSSSDSSPSYSDGGSGSSGSFD